MKGLSRRALFGAGLAGTVSATCGFSQNEAPSDYIDAHVHVWTPDTERYPLAPGFRREQMRPPGFTPEDLFAHARPCGVARVVLIQMSFYRFDNSYMLDVMEQHRGVFSGVAVIDSDAPDPAREMRALKRRGVRGFRIQPGKALDTWLEKPGMAAMWECGAAENLAMCPLINPDALPSLDRMCRRFPKTPLVIDHFARIGASGEIRDADLDRLCRLADHQKVHVKISAFYALGRKRPPYVDLLPMVRRLLEAYGPDRLMWATDCPYQVQPGHTYRESLELIRDRLDGISEAGRRLLLGGTAARIFFS
jgi:predicted TIM-barrel fold metal-dependent hydrolase